MGPRVEDDEVVIICLDHDFLVELLQKLDLLVHPVKINLLKLLSCVHVDHGHWYLVVHVVVKQEHYPVAYFELSHVFFLYYKLQLVCSQAPHSKAVFVRVLGYYLRIQFIELHEIRVSQNEILEQLVAFELLGQQEEWLACLLGVVLVPRCVFESLLYK